MRVKTERQEAGPIQSEVVVALRTTACTSAIAERCRSSPFTPSTLASTFEENTVVPIQVLGELYNVLVRKSGWPGDQARSAIMTWRDAFRLVPTSEAAIIAAADLAADHRLGIWDSLMLAVAAEDGCRLLLSEDMQHGFSWRGVTVVNPFAVAPHPLVRHLIGRCWPGRAMKSAEIRGRLLTELWPFAGGHLQPLPLEGRA